jgi:hypothetical protein
MMLAAQDEATALATAGGAARERRVAGNGRGTGVTTDDELRTTR